MAFDYGAIDEIIKKHDYKKSAIIAMLQDIQQLHRYLPREIFSYVSKEVRVSEASIYSVATFYENFSLEPKGKYVIKCCDGTACHLRKSIPILNRLRDDLGLSAGKVTTDDLMFTVETVACLGSCSLAPVLTVNGKVYAAMTPEKASELLNSLKGGQEIA